MIDCSGCFGCFDCFGCLSLIGRSLAGLKLRTHSNSCGNSAGLKCCFAPFYRRNTDEHCCLEMEIEVGLMRYFLA